MKTANIRDYKGGWFVGDFEPSIFQNPFFEVSHQHHKQGTESEPHTHMVTTEITYILKGRATVSGLDMISGDIFVYEKEDIADVKFLEDTDIVIVRWPSIPSDKYLIDNN
jgi:hypothetical protein|tara:strand:- start:11733 stop:12062 length:330 start_codon:yes stop_codon:yes gene_type:complete